MAKKKRASQKLASNAATIDWPAQALVARGEYSAPVDAIFDFGAVDWKKWADYQALAFVESDVPELIRLACDSRLDYAESPLLFSAPIHAMRILARRGNPDFLPALFESFEPRDDYDYFREEITPLIAVLGIAALPAVRAFFALPESSPYDRAVLSNGLVKVAQNDRAARESVIQLLQGELARFRENSEEWNGFLIADLIDLAAGETLPLIERALAADAVDEMICGDLQEVRAEFGLAPPRHDTNPLFLTDTRAKLPHLLRPAPPPKKA